MNRITAALLLLAPCLPAFADGQTTNDAIYSKSQAEAGEQLYQDHCLLCHDKKYFRPVFKTWEGKSLGMLNTVMNTSMPLNNPASLALQDYVDILAYMLSLNRYPAGDEPLPNDNDVLETITIAPH
jgi:mono/diheme cytochrome c family protein